MSRRYSDPSDLVYPRVSQPSDRSIGESLPTASRILAVFLAASGVRGTIDTAALLLLVAVSSSFAADTLVATRWMLLGVSLAATPLLLVGLLNQMNEWRFLTGRRQLGLVVATVCAYLLSRVIPRLSTRDLSESLPKSWLSLLALVLFAALYFWVLCAVWIQWLCPKGTSPRMLVRGAVVWWLGVLLSCLVAKLMIHFAEPNRIGTHLNYITLAKGQTSGQDWFLACVAPNWVYVAYCIALLLFSAVCALFAIAWHRGGIRSILRGVWKLISLMP